MADLDDPARIAAALDETTTELAADAQLDALVSGVAAVAQAPIALVSVVRDRTQFFRAYFGVSGELAMSRATSRCDSFCQFVVRDEMPFVVKDAHTDTRIPKALVEPYGIRSYLGVPLRYSGQVIGSVCAIDIVPRDFTAIQIEAVHGLASYISKRLEDMRVSAAPSPSAPADAAALARDVDIIEREIVELGPVMRLMSEVTKKQLTGEKLVRGVLALSETVGLYDDVLARIRKLRAALRT